MASSINATKFINYVFRKRLAYAYELSELYRPTINRRKDKLIELIKEKAEVASQSSVARNLRVLKGYYSLEMSPPSSNAEMEKLRADIALIKDFIKSGCFKYLTVKQAFLLFLVGTEIGLWFFLGETIGKMHIIGYKV